MNLPNKLTLLRVIMIPFFILCGIIGGTAGGGVVIAASMWGKVKTVIQMIVIIYTLIPLNIGQNFAFGTFTVTDILMLVLALVTVISGAEYLYNNRTLLKE